MKPKKYRFHSVARSVNPGTDSFCGTAILVDSHSFSKIKEKYHGKPFPVNNR
ncbi:hypothetical protein [Acetobacterium woodii]|uniref:hypothetical protein n=1 Tax=Acetobacterium woodii TaxID=33952 RepID=UPI0002FC127F|nr:hypothetical protein [Acetobacterium woodii]